MRQKKNGMEKMDEDAKKIIFKISNNPSVNFLRYKPYFLERDVYNLVSIIFNIESAFRLGKEVDSVDIPISKESSKYWGNDKKKIEEEIKELISFVTLNYVKINLVEKDTNKSRRNKKVEFKPCKNLCLFSGGVDSLTGLILTLKNMMIPNHYL